MPRGRYTRSKKCYRCDTPHFGNDRLCTFCKEEIAGEYIAGEPVATIPANTPKANRLRVAVRTVNKCGRGRSGQ